MSSASTQLSRQLEAYTTAQLSDAELQKCFAARCAQAVMTANPLGGSESRCCRVTLQAATTAMSAREQVTTLPVLPTNDLGAALRVISQFTTEAFEASATAQSENVPASCPRHRSSKNT